MCLRTAVLRTLCRGGVTCAVGVVDGMVVMGHEIEGAGVTSWEDPVPEEEAEAEVWERPAGGDREDVVTDLWLEPVDPARMALEDEDVDDE